MVKWVSGFLLVAMMVASGCARQAIQQGNPNVADASSTVPPTQSLQPITREKAIEMASSKVEFISPEKAVEIAKGVNSKVTWEARFDVDFKYEYNGQERQRPAWVVQALSPAPNTTLWIDAQTSEILVVRQTEAPAPSAGM